MKIPVTGNSGQNFDPTFSWSQLLLGLSVPLLVFLVYWGWKSLVDPSFGGVSETEILQELTLPPPQTVNEIKEELKRANLTLGEIFPIEVKDVALYPVFNQKKELQQIRVYRAGGRKFRGKWHLADAVEVTGLRKSTIDAPRQRYTLANRLNADPILPFNDLHMLEGERPEAEVWFLARGNAPNGAFGLVFHLALTPQPRLFMLKEWVSPVGKLPQWQETISIPPKPGATDLPEIVIDQSLAPEPLYEMLRVIPTGDVANPYELRTIELAERGKIGKTYSNALILARSGLWSPAMKVWTKADEKLSIPVREQHAYIAFHAQLTAKRAAQEIADTGDRVRNLLIDGQFATALELATRSESNARSVVTLLKKNDQPFWNRMNGSLQVNNDPKAYPWGAIMVMIRKNLPSARQWLAERSRNNAENLAVLDVMDVAPLTVKPQQFLGTLKQLDGPPDDRWYIPPGKLTPGQTWYIVNPMILRDSNTWKNTPIAEFGERSPKTVWKALGLDRNPILNIVETDRADYPTFFSVNARSIWVGEGGEVEILATGSEYVTRGVSGNRLPIVAVSGGTLSQVPSQPLRNLSSIIADRVSRAVYGELRTFGEVSLDLASFQERLLEWQVLSVDINGDNVVELILQIQQDQIDLGNRYYPMVAVFNIQGELIYSTIREASPRNWVGILPGSTGGQVLTELDGRYEIWNF